MPLKYNGVDIDRIIYNGKEIDKLIFNGVTVWEGAFASWAEFGQKYAGKALSDPCGSESKGTIFINNNNACFRTVTNSFPVTGVYGPAESYTSGGYTLYGGYIGTNGGTSGTWTGRWFDFQVNDGLQTHSGAKIVQYAQQSVPGSIITNGKANDRRMSLTIIKSSVPTLTISNVDLDYAKSLYNQQVDNAYFIPNVTLPAQAKIGNSTYTFTKRTNILTGRGINR